MLQRNPTILWFRDDLRLRDHPALAAASAIGAVLSVFILDEGFQSVGRASKWWLHHALRSLVQDIQQQSGQLVLRQGNAAEILSEIAKDVGAQSIHALASRIPAERDDQNRVMRALHQVGISLILHDGALLHNPMEVRTKTGEAFKVFTPFWKAFLKQDEKILQGSSWNYQVSWYENALDSLTVDELLLLLQEPDGIEGLRTTWSATESAARDSLDTFVLEALSDYSKHRDFPAIPGTSRLSPYLRWGQISPYTIWRRIRIEMSLNSHLENSGWVFLRQLGWREFAHHVLSSHPDIAFRNLKPSFDAFPWQDNVQNFELWRTGQTGFSLVDAGMQELMKTGWMHNRVRMVAASFLIKDLMQDWRRGLAWFEDALVDADPAIDPFSWQWVAGSGADAAPFFRVFNPEMQKQKFDPDQRYVSAWLQDEQTGIGPIRHGNDGAHKIVDHAEARRRALEAFHGLPR